MAKIIWYAEVKNEEGETRRLGPFATRAEAQEAGEEYDTREGLPYEVRVRPEAGGEADTGWAVRITEEDDTERFFGPFAEEEEAEDWITAYAYSRGGFIAIALIRMTTALPA